MSFFKRMLAKVWAPTLKLADVSDTLLDIKMLQANVTHTALLEMVRETKQHTDVILTKLSADLAFSNSQIAALSENITDRYFIS